MWPRPCWSLAGGSRRSPCFIFSALFRRALLAGVVSRRAPSRRATVLWMRWIRESVNTLLPVAGVGGDVVGARLVHQRGVPGAQATASHGGRHHGRHRRPSSSLSSPAWRCSPRGQADDERARSRVWGARSASPCSRRRSPSSSGSSTAACLERSCRLAHRLAPKSWMSGFTGRAEAIDEAIVATYRRRSAFATFQSAAAHRMGDRRGRSLAGDARPRSSLQPGRRVHPRKPDQRRARRGVHGARRARRPRRRHGAVRRAARTARGPGARGFAHRSAFASWRWACRALRPGNGWKGAVCSLAGGAGELDPYKTAERRRLLDARHRRGGARWRRGGAAAAGDPSPAIRWRATSIAGGRPSASRNCARRV